MTKTKFWGLVALLVLLSSGSVWAQVTTGTISGTVKDGSGAPVPGVKVTVLNEGTGVARTVDSDEEGRYSAFSLSLGEYKVTGVQQGFQTEVRTGIVLTVGRQAIVDLVRLPAAYTKPLLHMNRHRCGHHDRRLVL